jgi:hypothetical protein
VLYLSKIFEWYRSDFGDSDQELVTALMPYFSEELRSELKDRLDTVKVEFLEYDWSLAAADMSDVNISGASTSDTSGENNQERLQERNYSAEFPPEVEYWLAQQDNYELGLKEADQLRRKLLARIAVPVESEAPDRTYADRIAIVVQSFQRQVEHIELSTPVSAFQVTSSRLMDQLDGKVCFGKEAGVFAAFDGKWFGLWDVHPVNHDWRPSRVHSPVLSYSELGLQVKADQYAWIHNGFGWNYLARESVSDKLPFVLGQVYYLNANDLKTIEARKPHVGFADLPEKPSQAIHRLVWITEHEIFLEEVFPQDKPDDTYYAITGIFHRLLTDKPTVSNTFVQAKYTRRSNLRPAFRHIEWKPPREFSPSEP